MNRLLYHGIVLAEGSRLEGLSREFRGRRSRFDTQDIVIALMVVAAIAVAIFLVSYYLNLQERRRGSVRPLRLFLSLCQAHRLRWSERWLLWRVSRIQRLRDPARLFIEPQRLQPANLGRSLRARQAQFDDIRGRLFGQLQQDWEESESEAAQTLHRLARGTLLSAAPPNRVPDLDSLPPTAGPGVTPTGSL